MGNGLKRRQISTKTISKSCSSTETDKTSLVDPKFNETHNKHEIHMQSETRNELEIRNRTAIRNLTDYLRTRYP
jgi:hypothetical protein